MLPLHYKSMAPDVGIEPTLKGLESFVFPLDQSDLSAKVLFPSFPWLLMDGA
jgi:hypothetical protein